MNRRFLCGILISIMLLGGCASQGISSNSSDMLSRLNASGSDVWIEDPASDFTGSNSLATYLIASGDGCAVWVFENADSAKIALESGQLTFPGMEIYNGPDSETNLGIILVSPFSGASCEYTAANAFGWGK